MSTLFEELKQGLEEAISVERGERKAKTVTLAFDPVSNYTGAEVRNIRNASGLSQKALAQYMGVSQKTVEAWECGRNHPTGPACRLLALLEKNDAVLLPFVHEKTADR